MAPHWQAHSYNTTQTWPPMGRVLTSVVPVITQTIIEDDYEQEDEGNSKATAAVPSGQGNAQNSESNEEAEEEEEEDDSDDDNDSTETVRPSRPADVSKVTAAGSTRYWSCLTCWAELSSRAEKWCTFCDMTTSTIARSHATKLPFESDGTEGEDTTTPWICVDCEAPKLFLGGHVADVPIFQSYCAQCQCRTDTVYATRQASYCCSECRYERPTGSEPRQVTLKGQVYWMHFWNKWCRQCVRSTDTVKLDHTSSNRHCCVDCRLDRDVANDDIDEEQWCAFCGAHTETIELDDETEDA